jgi:hypothetical protein
VEKLGPILHYSQGDSRTMYPHDRACILWDLRRTVPDHIKIIHSNLTLWQPIDFKTLPQHCNICRSDAHLSHTCLQCPIEVEALQVDSINSVGLKDSRCTQSVTTPVGSKQIAVRTTTSENNQERMPDISTKTHEQDNTGYEVRDRHQGQTQDINGTHLGSEHLRIKIDNNIPETRPAVIERKQSLTPTKYDPVYKGKSSLCTPRAKEMNSYSKSIRYSPQGKTKSPTKTDIKMKQNKGKHEGNDNSNNSSECGNSITKE